MNKLPSLEFIANYFLVEEPHMEAQYSDIDIPILVGEIVSDYQDASQRYSSLKNNSDTFFVCLATKSCIDQLLLSYLRYRGREYEAGRSVSEMLALCSKIDDDFKTVSFDCLICRGTTPGGKTALHCMSHNSVSKCMKLADRLCQLVTTKVKS